MYPTEFVSGNKRRIEYHDLGPDVFYRYRFDGNTFLTVTEYQEIKDWCRDHLGEDDEVWMALNGVFMLHEDNHAFEFRLRWC